MTLSRARQIRDEVKEAAAVSGLHAERVGFSHHSEGRS